jgi:hypothetical protein
MINDLKSFLNSQEYLDFELLYSFSRNNLIKYLHDKPYYVIEHFMKYYKTDYIYDFHDLYNVYIENFYIENKRNIHPNYKPYYPEPLDSPYIISLNNSFESGSSATVKESFLSSNTFKESESEYFSSEDSEDEFTKIKKPLKILQVLIGIKKNIIKDNIPIDTNEDNISDFESEENEEYISE